MRRSLKIDRTKDFDFKDLLGKDFEVSEQDKKSLLITDLNLLEIELDSTLEKGQTSITGETRVTRLKQKKQVRLDALICKTILENKSLIPKRWKDTKNGFFTFIHFDGTIFVDSYGDRFSLFIVWRDYKSGWEVGKSWLDFDCSQNSLSAIIVEKDF